jgi:hypothetical protein
MFFDFFYLYKSVFRKKTIHQKIQNILFILAIPMVISIVLSSLNSNNKESQMRLMKEITIDIGKKDLNHFLDLRMLASTKGRVDAWKAMVENSEKPLIGYGSQGDRGLAKKLETNSQLASNSFVYALICSGFVGFFFLIVFYYKLIKLLFVNNFLKNNLTFFYFTILIFLIIRSFFENSFAVWGVDFILIVNSYLGFKNSFTKENQIVKN